MEKLYDISDGHYYWEKKVIKTKLGAIIDFQIIKERKLAEEIEGEVAEEAPPVQPDITGEPADNDRVQ